MNDPVLYASSVLLSRADMTALRIKDAYSIHKLVFGLFDDIRSEQEKHKSVSSGIVYADKGGDFNHRQIMILSNRKPHQTPQFGTVQTKLIPAQFLRHDRYGFEIKLNPTRRENASKKIIAMRGRGEIDTWFRERSPTWGFQVQSTALVIEQLSVQTFEKAGHQLTHGSATVRGELLVKDQVLFMDSFAHGIGRGRAFGFGLLQIIPL